MKQFLIIEHDHSFISEHSINAPLVPLFDNNIRCLVMYWLECWPYKAELNQQWWLEPTALRAR